MYYIKDLQPGVNKLGMCTSLSEFARQKFELTFDKFGLELEFISFNILTSCSLNLFLFVHELINLVINFFNFYYK